MNKPDKKTGWQLILIGLGIVFPLPPYGNHIGYDRETELPPVDSFDACGIHHDETLKHSWDRYGDYVKIWVQDIQGANARLRQEAMDSQAEGWWGKVLRFFIIRGFLDI